MFLRPAMGAAAEEGRVQPRQVAVTLAVVLSVATTLAFGAIPPAAQALIDSARLGAQIKPAVNVAPRAVTQRAREDDESLTKRL
jgi:hypothetical protein